MNKTGDKLARAMEAEAAIDFARARVVISLVTESTSRYAYELRNRIRAIASENSFAAFVDCIAGHAAPYIKPPNGYVVVGHAWVEKNLPALLEAEETRAATSMLVHGTLMEPNAAPRGSNDAH